MEVGGGIRSLTAIEKILGTGVERVILGTIAVEDKDLIRNASHRFGNGIVIGVDVREGRLATRGWLKDETVTAIDFVKQMMDLNISRFIYTDIVRDGTLIGPNYTGVNNLITETRCNLIVAGGIASIEHLQKLNSMPVEGAIIGKALYTGDIDLTMALRTIKQNIL